MQIFKKLLLVLTSAGFKYLDLLLITIIIIIIMILSDMIGHDFITPFMTIIINPDPLEVSTIFNSAYVKTQVA